MKGASHEAQHSTSVGAAAAKVRTRIWRDAAEEGPAGEDLIDLLAAAALALPLGVAG